MTRHPPVRHKVEAATQRAESGTTICVSFHRSRVMGTLPDVAGHVRDAWSRQGLLIDDSEARSTLAALTPRGSPEGRSGPGDVEHRAGPPPGPG